MKRDRPMPFGGIGRVKNITRSSNAHYGAYVVTVLNNFDIKTWPIFQATCFRSKSRALSFFSKPLVGIISFFNQCNLYADLIPIFLALFLKKGYPRPLFRLFSSFQTNITNLTTDISEKCPSSIWCRDSNPQPSEQESPPLTTRPGLPP